MEIVNSLADLVGYVVAMILAFLGFFCMHDGVKLTAPQKHTHVDRIVTIVIYIGSIVFWIESYKWLAAAS